MATKEDITVGSQWKPKDEYVKEYPQLKDGIAIISDKGLGFDGRVCYCFIFGVTSELAGEMGIQKGDTTGYCYIPFRLFLASYSPLDGVAFLVESIEKSLEKMRDEI